MNTDYKPASPEFPEQQAPQEGSRATLTLSTGGAELISGHQARYEQYRNHTQGQPSPDAADPSGVGEGLPSTWDRRSLAWTPVHFPDTGLPTWAKVAAI